MKNIKSKIYDELVMLSVAIGQKQDPQRLQIYAENLSNLDLNKLLGIIQGMSRTQKFFPQMAEILEHFKAPEIPTDELAMQFATDITDAIPRFGYSNEKEAREHLAEKWGIVERFGGWQMLCQTGSYQELNTVRAQVRELAKAYINRSKRECAELGIPFSLNTEPVKIEARKEKPGLQLIKFESEF